MKKIAFFGAHGTGKTTVFEELKRTRTDWFYFQEMARVKSVAFGYNDPWEIEKEVGEAVLEVMLISHFGTIDSKFNPFVDAKNDQILIADRSPVDYYGYYLTERKNNQDFILENFLKKMTQYYVDLFDLFIYFPIGVIPLIGDKMRPSDQKYQIDIDKNMLEAVNILNIPKTKIYTIKSEKINERVEELIKIISKIK